MEFEVLRSTFEHSRETSEKKTTMTLVLSSHCHIRWSFKITTARTQTNSNRVNIALT